MEIGEIFIQRRLAEPSQVEAARREVQEELGLTGLIRVRQRLDRVMYFFRNHFGQPRLKTVLLFLIHYKGSPTLRPRKREGVLAADWVSFGEAKDRLLHSGGRYLRALETAEWMLRHRAGEALGLPVLTIVFNNGVWKQVRSSTEAVYPDGHAMRANRMPLTSLEPAPRYEMIVEASGGYGERVEAAEDLPAALERALHAIKREKRQALLNVLSR